VTKKIIIAVISILAVAAILYKGKALLKTRSEQAANQKLPLVKPISVKVINPVSKDLDSKISYLATIQAKKSINLSTKLAGYIKKVLVNNSSVVKKGDLLVVIDDAEILSNIASLKSTYASQNQDAALALTVYKRNLKLYKVGGLAKEMLENSKVALNLKKSKALATKEKIAQLQNQLRYLKIKAPFDGVVDKVLLHEGDLAAAGKPIVKLSTYKKKLVFTFPPENSAIKKGLKVFSNYEYIGDIDIVNTAAQNGLATAEVLLKKDITKPNGSSIPIDIVVAKGSGCKVTKDALIHKKDATYVMVYNGSKFSPKKVDIKLDSGDSVLLESCPNNPIAVAPETKLVQLPVYSKVNIIGANR